MTNISGAMACYLLRLTTPAMLGLVTDIGNEAAQLLHPKTEKTAALRNKLRLRLIILVCYIAGGLLFIQYSFTAFFCIALLVIILLVYDLLKKEALA